MRIDVEGCELDIVPIVKGLVSDAEKVADALSREYDAVGVALGPEDIPAMRNRKEIIDEHGMELSDLELVYSHHLMNFGKIDFPTPAFSTLVDICDEKGITLYPLDMGDETYSDVYCENVSTMELLKEQKLAKKGLKGKFDMTSPEAFADSWDTYINKVKGFNALSVIREDFMADSLKKMCNGKRNALAVIEVERVNGIIRSLAGGRAE